MVSSNSFLVVIAVLSALVCPWFADLSMADNSSDVQMVRMAGSPEEIGRMWGEINKAGIESDFNRYFLEPAKENGISQEKLIEASKKFIRIAEEISPHWLKEAKAIAAAAGVDEDLYISFIANVYSKLFLHDECTSYAVSKRFTKDNAVFFHKNRDNVDKNQSVFILDSSVKGINKFISVSDVSVIACMMMVNEKGLAGAADTGSGLELLKPSFRGMYNTFMLRYIAERASTCREALAIIQMFIDKGYYAGGNGSGTHWLFVDKEGTILEVCSRADRLTYKYHTDEKVYFSVRGDTPAAKTLINAAGPIDFHLYHNVSRDPSMCFSTSISGMTVEIDKQYPEFLTCVWVSFPAKSLSFPIFMGAEKTPLPLLDGSLYSIARKTNCDRSIFEKLEENSYFSKQLLAEKVSLLLKAKKSKKAVGLLDRNVQSYTSAHIGMLKSFTHD